MHFKDILNILKDTINSEVKSVKRLEGDKLKRFAEIFNVSENAEIFFNDYNIVITDIGTHEILSTFIDSKNSILELKMTHSNSYLWIYEYLNDQLFENYLND